MTEHHQPQEPLSPQEQRTLDIFHALQLYYDPLTAQPPIHASSASGITSAEEHRQKGARQLFEFYREDYHTEVRELADMQNPHQTVFQFEEEMTQHYKDHIRESLTTLIHTHPSHAMSLPAYNKLYAIDPLASFHQAGGTVETMQAEETARMWGIPAEVLPALSPAEEKHSQIRQEVLEAALIMVEHEDPILNQMGWAWLGILFWADGMIQPLEDRQAVILALEDSGHRRKILEHYKAHLQHRNELQTKNDQPS